MARTTARPAILTEYMLAGPAGARQRRALRCGLDFIRPDTGLAAPAEAFAEAILALLARAPDDGAARRGPRTLGLGEND